MARAYFTLRELDLEMEISRRTLATRAVFLRLTTAREQGGVASFLEVLVTQRDLFDAELLLAQAWRDEILAVVQLYKTLGGGWQTEGPPPAPTAASEPRPQTVGPSADAGGTGAAGGGPVAGGGNQTTWGKVKAFLGSLLSRW